MGKTYWYDSPNPDKFTSGLFGWSVKWITAFIVAAILIGVGIWWVIAATSDTRGRAEAEASKNSASNRIEKQERFVSLFNEIKSADQRITVLAAAVQVDPNQFNKTNLTGAKTYCLNVVGQYNAEALKFTAEAFRPTGLPHQIDTNDPATDCKEN